MQRRQEHPHLPGPRLLSIFALFLYIVRLVLDVRNAEAVNLLCQVLVSALLTFCSTLVSV